MKIFITGAVCWLFLGAVAWGQDPPAKKEQVEKEKVLVGELRKQAEKDSPAEKFAEAKKAQVEAEKSFNKVIADLRAKKEELTLENKTLKEAFDARNKANQAAVAAAKELIKVDPKSKTAFEAITFVINYSGPTPDVIKMLAEHHVTNPDIGSVCNRLSFGPANQETKDFLKAVMEKNSSKDARGNATMTLAQIMMRGQPAEAEKLFEKVIAEYKDVKWFRGTLGERAESNLFELRNLQVGKVAPEIEGEDMDGKKFKLSDYRGKVVMLDFWGHW